MNRFFGAFIVLAVVLTIVVTGFRINTKTANSVTEKINSSINYHENGNITLAKKEIKSALDEWEDNMETMLLFISHGRLDEIEEALNVANTYIELGDENMYIAECRRAAILIQHFENIEYPTINNIF